MKRAINLKDIIGRTFGQLTIVKLCQTDKSKRPWKYYYECKCACGTTKIITRVNLISGHALSCGCLRKKKGKDSKSWTGHGDLSKRLFTSIKRHAISRNLKFSITIEDAWKQFEKQNGKCALTGKPLTIHLYKNNITDRTASLDRINSNNGYTIDNIQWIHKDVNYIKMDLDQEYFIQLCKLIANYSSDPTEGSS